MSQLRQAGRNTLKLDKCSCPCSLQPSIMCICMQLADLMNMLKMAHRIIITATACRKKAGWELSPSVAWRSMHRTVCWALLPWAFSTPSQRGTP